MCSLLRPFAIDQNDFDDLIKRNIEQVLLSEFINRLQRRFDIYSKTCPLPLIAPNLLVTPEIRHQSEFYLPISEISSVFNHLYRSSLTYSPILSSTPFYKSMSWVDSFVALPSQFQFSANPAILLKKLLVDRGLLIEFLFTSFMPHRFYGSFARYPAQLKFIREWLTGRNMGTIRCLDAACGTGEETYNLVLLLLGSGLSAKNVRVEGWTVEPLEVRIATKCHLTNDRLRNNAFREITSDISEEEYQHCISFSCVDLTKGETLCSSKFDLIICNGLLGGPIVNSRKAIEIVIRHLVERLSPGGILLAADHFHGGWKQHCPQQELQAVFEFNGLRKIEVGEGIGGLKLDQ